MAIFPGAVATDSDLYIAVNNLSTLLTDNPLTIGATTVNVISTTGFPTVGFISIGAEIIKYTGTTATSFTGCTRGADGTSAAAHALNDQVDHNVIAGHHNALKDETIAVESFISTHIGLTTNVLAAEFEFLDGVTSNIQTQLNTKATDTLVVHLAGTETLTGQKTLNDLRFGGNVTANSFKITGLAAGTTAGDSTRYEQVILITGVNAFTANQPMGGFKLTGLGAGTTAGDSTRYEQVILITGANAFTANQPMGGFKLTGLAAGTTNGDSVRYEQVLLLTGGTMSGDIDMGGNDLRGVATLNDTFLSAFRNRIINGAMTIDQRNEGAAYTINTDPNVYTLDRYAASGEPADGVFTVVRSTSTPPTGFTHFLRATVTTADASIGASQSYNVLQFVEGSFVRDFLLGSASAATFTLSFWIRSSLTGSFSGSFANSAFNRSYPFSYTISSANTWEKKTITLTGDTTGTWLNSDATIGLGIRFDLGSGTSVRGTAGAWTGSGFVGVTGAVSLIATNAATWDLTGLQLEIGNYATAYEYKAPVTTIQMCERHYEKTFPVGTAVAQNSGTTVDTIYYRVAVAGSTTHSQSWVYKTRKMTAPTVTFYNTSAANANWRNLSDAADSSAASLSASSGARIAIVTSPQVAGDGVAEILVVHASAEAEL